MAQTLTDLLEALADPDDATREEAAQALVAQPNAKATDALIEALADEYWSVRMYAAHALAKIPGPRIIEVLVPLLGDLIKECRDGAVEDFVAIGPLALGELPKGGTRPLEQQEKQDLDRAMRAPNREPGSVARPIWICK